QPRVPIAPDPAAESEVGLQQCLLADPPALAERNGAEAVRVGWRGRRQVGRELLSKPEVILVERDVAFEEALGEEPVVRRHKRGQERRRREDLVLDFKRSQPLHGRKEVYIEGI